MISTLELVGTPLLCLRRQSRPPAGRRSLPRRRPPGMYFTVINNRLIQSQHKNARWPRHGRGRHDRSVHRVAAHRSIFLNEGTRRQAWAPSHSRCPRSPYTDWGSRGSLVAAGGRGFHPRHIGYRVWPKLGFDADLLPGELDDPPWAGRVPDRARCSGCGCGCVGSRTAPRGAATFDLAADSRCWRKTATPCPVRCPLRIPMAKPTTF